MEKQDRGSMAEEQTKTKQTESPTKEQTQTKYKQPSVNYNPM
jgi:hypothetical protein